MGAPIRITFLYNAAVQVECRGRQILLDALYTSAPEGLSPPLPRLWEALMRGEAPFDQVDTVLCSHLHPDHYSAAAVGEYLERRGPRRLLLPRAALHGGNPLTPSRPEAVLPLEEHRLTTVVELPGGDRITALRTVHMGPQYGDVIHYCFLLELDGRRVFLAADAGGVENDLTALLAPLGVDCMVVNPLFIAHQNGRRVLAQLQPSSCCIYHIPAEADDTRQMRRMTLHYLERYPELRDAVPFLTGGQSMVL